MIVIQKTHSRKVPSQLPIVVDEGEMENGGEIKVAVERIDIDVNVGGETVEVGDAIRAAAAANASRVCATSGAQSDAGCAASTAFPSPRRWKTVIRALKREVRIKFGPNVTAPAPSDNHGYLGYLTMHVTEYAQEARLLNAVLSKYNLSSGEDAVHTLHNHPATTRLPTAQSWCSAVSNSSKYTRTALSALFLNGSRA